jgi:para-aminobenzoate synthetase / 4-amino-4-deoxychorismate lyase
VNVPTSPDPSRGLFETLLVADGAPVELEAHLARLAASARELFDAELPGDIAVAAERACEGIELGRLRIEIEPDGEGGFAQRFQASPIDPGFSFPDREHGELLRSVPAEDWSGAHKWSDRDSLERTERRLGEEVPLLVDAAGDVLEAGRANVFAVIAGELLTPPADGRILPGTARAATLRLAAELGIEASERPLRLAELRDADEVFLTSSVRGLRPARRLDGHDLPARSHLTERLAEALQDRWLSAPGLSALSAGARVPLASPRPGRSA